MPQKHIPVLLNSVMDALGDVTNKVIVDCTFGAGGYSRAFLSGGANVIAFDRDPNVAPDAEQLKKQYPTRFDFVPMPFSNLGTLGRQVDAVVFDLGISSMQIDNPERGFSFRADAPLDMRMSQTGVSAKDLIQQLSVADLANVLRQYGDVKKANLLARIIKENMPKTTLQLRELIHNPKDVAPVFQALRIAVNNEMGELEQALDAVPDMLNVGGMCICVTFHSLEDRIVKNVFKKWTTVPGDPRIPTNVSAKFQMLGTVVPNQAELENNSRARSAHLRGVIKSC